MFHNWDWLINFCARRGQKNAQFRYVTFLMNLLSTQLWTGVKCSALSNFNKALQIPPSTPSTPPNRHHQTVMRSYKCIVLRQANNLPFLSVFFFMAMHWTGTVPLCDEGIYTTGFIGTVPYSSATSPNDPQCDSGSFTDVLSTEDII